MGFIISQSIDTLNHGSLTASYARIERYTFDKNTGNCYATVAMYPSYQDAKDSTPPYLTGFSNVGHYFDPSDSSYSGSKVVATKISYSGSQFDYPSYVFIPCTASIVVQEPVYQNLVTSQSVTYSDFDSSGNVVTMSRIEYTTQSVQVGTQPVTRYVSNLDSITGSFYTFVYQGVKTVYGSIFGNQNLIDA